MQGNYQIGDVVMGNWKLVRFLGSGSFGYVFEAERRDFGTVYRSAIKIITIPHDEQEVRNIRAEGMDEASITSYFRGMVEDQVREFQMMSKLKGTANIVCYEDHAVLKHKGGFGWDILIRMELLTPLMDWLEGRSLTSVQIAGMGIGICHALELCQKIHVIHRDIKPENIFVSEFGDLKLGDFGIARIAEKTSSNLSHKGTYNYMAPEVYLKQRYGPSVDLYSLGIVLYWMLNDWRLPFLPVYPAPITYNDREMAFARRMRGEIFPAPRRGDRNLTQIVQKACSFNPTDRYSSATEMCLELKKYCEQAKKPAGTLMQQTNIKVYSEQQTIADGHKEQENIPCVHEDQQKPRVVMAIAIPRNKIPEKEINETVSFGETFDKERKEDPKFVKEADNGISRAEAGGLETVIVNNDAKIENPKNFSDSILAKRHKIAIVVAAAICMAVFAIAAGRGGYSKQQGTAVIFEQMIESADDKEKVFRRLEKKADKGDLNAVMLVADCYYNGRVWDDFEVAIDYEKAVKYWEQAADLGNDFAMVKSGECYEYGRGVEQDYKRAVEYYEKASDLGNAEAMSNLGFCYKNGNGVTQDYAKAVEYYKKAADLGDTGAMRCLGVCYQNGNGVTQDCEKAVEYFEKAADLGDAGAMRSLGVYYEEGIGVTQDYAKAVEYYEKAADLEDVDAMLYLGDCYENGNGVTQDYAKASEYYKKAVEYYEKATDLGDANAIYRLGTCYEKGNGVTQDYAKAVKYYEKAADLGNTDAIWWLGVCYQFGNGVTQDDAKAVEYYEKAADLGSSAAMRNLGIFYQLGNGVIQDYAKAVEHYKKAADLGDVIAMTNLGNCYKNGNGVTQDYEKAVEYYEKAANLGDATAMYNLGMAYTRGNGVTQNYAKAVEYYEKAVGLGNKEAIMHLGICYENGYGVTQDYEKAIEYYEKAADLGVSSALLYLEDIKGKLP